MRSQWSRRDFHKLTAAAFGGIVAGSLPGCGSGEKPKPAASTGGDAKTDATAAAAASGAQAKVAANDWLGDVHVCRGLNACKNKGKAGTNNECAGRGNCHTLKEDHTCHAANDCKYQGGCGKTAGQNECAKKGECAVPLMSNAWKDARASFEAAMKKAGKTVGEAPPAPKS